jgi:hypothetical protein
MTPTLVLGVLWGIISATALNIELHVSSIWGLLTLAVLSSSAMIANAVLHFAIVGLILSLLVRVFLRERVGFGCSMDIVAWSFLCACATSVIVALGAMVVAQKPLSLDNDGQQPWLQWMTIPIALWSLFLIASGYSAVTGRSRLLLAGVFAGSWGVATLAVYAIFWWL